MQVLLDRYGDALQPSGYRLLQTEIEFLRYADAPEPLFVRGADLCEWAELYCRVRRIPCQTLRSPVQELCGVCPDLETWQAEEIIQLLGNGFAQLPRPLSVQAVLASLYPQRLWRDDPSWEHGAAWLHWLVSTAFPKTIEPLLATLARQWQQQSNQHEAQIYTAISPEDAQVLLLSWLDVVDTKLAFTGGEFPLPVPEKVRKHLHSEWKRQLVTTKGAHIRRLLTRRRMPRDLKTEAAAIAASVFLQHPALFTSQYMQEMRPYLNGKQQNELQNLIIPKLPEEMPVIPDDLLHWYRRQYLPYRMWQTKQGTAEARTVVQNAAVQFMDWYLQEYPKALLGGSLQSHLSFEYSMQLAASNQEFATLIVVLDGLQVDDGVYVLQGLQKGTERLEIAQEALAFTALPTVTEFCKDALLKGTSPVHAPNYPALGEILAESRSPVEVLQSAKPGKLYLWRVQEPDATYHSRNTHQMLRRDIESQLDGITQKIIDVVNGVSDSVPLRIVVTTDHGRLLAESQRSQAIPAGMVSHGRAAWGDSGREFPATGYLIEGDLVFLHKERFGLPEDVAIVCTEEMFRANNDRTGKELYAHGGLYPEEVIVPWWVLLRDAGKPEISFRLSGRGRSSAQGTAELHVQNLSALAVQIVSLRLYLSGGRVIDIPSDLACTPLSDSRFAVSVSNWPSSQELSKTGCQIEVTLASGRKIDFPVTVALEAEEMYTRDQSLLEGLDL